MIELFEVVNINLNSKHRQKGLEFLMLDKVGEHIEFDSMLH